MWVGFGLTLCLAACGGIGAGNSDFGAKLPHGYKLWKTSQNKVVIHPYMNWNDNTEVPSKVVSCGFDDHYILAEQQLLDAKQRNPVRGKYQYWIIDALAQKRFGPFTEVEFNAQRKALGVSDQIKLRGTDSFRP